MARLVFYDPNTNRVKEYQPSGNENNYLNRNDLLIDPAGLDGVLSIPIKHWKYDNGSLREMSQIEKDQLISEEAAIKLTVDKASADQLEFSIQDVVVALVKRINLRLPSDKQITKQEIIDQLKQDKGL